MKSYIVDNKIPCEWRSVTGCRTFWTEPLASAAAEGVKKLKRDAPELGRIVTVVDDEGELKKLRINGAPGATLTAAAASLWPYKLVAFILEKLIKEGKLNLQTKTPVTKLEPCSDLPGTLLHTERGTIRTNTVILATVSNYRHSAANQCDH